MNKLVSLFLVVAFLALAVIACQLPIPTKAPTEAPPEQPTETPAEEQTPEGPSLGDTWTRPTDDMVMVYVPAGEFEMGSSDEEIDYALQLCNEYRGDCEREWFQDEQPAHAVVLDGFWIDQTEVTNAQYQQCVEAGACWGDANTNLPDHPAIDLSWYEAAEYCEWVKCRLPTEAEWEYAARGPDGWRYPWGNEFDGSRLNYCDVNCEITHWADETVDDGHAGTAPVGSFTGGASWCGALDMAGNAWEWVADWYDDYPSAQQMNPTGPPRGSSRVVRGGFSLPGPYDVRCAKRKGHSLEPAGLDIGFRCTVDVTP